MNTDKYQDEIMILDHENKTIKRVFQGNRDFIEKTFFQHENSDVYQKILDNPHPNICQVYNIDIKDDSFVVQEQYLGKTYLSDLVPIQDRAYFFELVYQLCDALEHLHKLKIVHRDLKPENIYYQEGVLVVNDFDISKPINPNDPRRQDTHMFGSLGFASPEQYGFSKSDERSDIYSLGVVMNVMLTGKLVSEALANDVITPIILKCTEMSPKDRYQSIAYLKNDLSRFEVKKYDYTLPGFRSGKFKHKVIAVLCYLTMASLILTTTASNGVTVWDDISAKISMAIAVIPFAMIVTNYLDIHSWIPKPLRKIKFVGPFLLYMSLLFILVLVQALVQGIISGIVSML